jgi:hypothetical protein
MQAGEQNNELDERIVIDRERRQEHDTGRGDTVSQTRLTDTRGWFTRINYADGDVLDHDYPSESIARQAARDGSCGIRGEIDVCHDAHVVATYARGAERTE